MPRPKNSRVQTIALPRAELVPTKALKANPCNARTHPKRQIDQLKRAFERFGFSIQSSLPLPLHP